MATNNRHPTKKISYYHPELERQIEKNIDEEIVDLIQLLWKCKIFTSSSCQADWEGKNTSGFIYIQSDTHQDCLKFLNIITDYDDPSDAKQMILYNAVQDEDGFVFRHNIIDLNHPVVDFPEDHSPNDLAPYRRPYPKHGFNVNMYFDPKWKGAIMAKLGEYLQREESGVDVSKERLKVISY